MRTSRLGSPVPQPDSCSATNQLLNHRISAGEQRKGHSEAERFGVPHFLATQISPHERYQTSVPEWDRQFRLVRVHHEHREELGWLRLAGIGADAVAVAGQLGEALSGR